MMIRQWTQDDDKRLRIYAEWGWSSRHIGDLMDRSRNSVIGRCHRQKIHLQGTPFPLKGKKA